MGKFHKFGFGYSARTSVAAMGAMKLAQMAEMSEEEFDSSSGTPLDLCLSSLFAAV